MLQQVGIKFVLLLRKTGTETHKVLETVHGYGALCSKFVFEQFKRQGHVCEDLQHDPDLGTVAEVQEMMARNF
jgi:hypothetical protein